MSSSKYFCVASALFFLSFSFSCSSDEHHNTHQSAEEKSETDVVLTTEQRIDNLKNELDLTKAEIAQNGDYDCCVKPACDWCLIHEGTCECYDNIKSGKKVCPGCGLGWHNGKGNVKGINKSEVVWNITHEHGKDVHKHKHKH